MSGARRTPRAVAVGIAARAKLRVSGVRPPAAVSPAIGRKNLFIGPANSAGQGFEWARAAERADPGIAAVSMAVVRPDDRFGFAVDQPVPHGFAVHDRGWQRRQFEALQRFDAVVLESGLPLAGQVFGGDPLAQLEALAAAGVRTALLFHGSDIRDPDRHLASELHSHFGVDPVFTEQLREVTRRNRRLAERSGIPVFVSTPDLLNEVAGARWLPLVITAEAWGSARPVLPPGERPQVVHLPSSSKIKGTELMLSTLQALDASGVIAFRALSGVTHDKMPEQYGAADIVIDQLRVGNYGVAACEALAAGRLVVSHVSEEVRRTVSAVTGDDLPIVEATAETLDEVLRDIAANPESYRRVAERGPEFVRRHHTGRRSGQMLAELCCASGMVQLSGGDTQ